MSGLLEPHTIGTSLPRIDGIAKVTGTAPYAYEQPVTDPLYLHPVQASIARGRVTEGLLTCAILNILEQLRGTVSSAPSPRDHRNVLCR